MGHTKFRISLLGFDQRCVKALGRATRTTIQVVEPISNDNTQVVVVDLDAPDGLKIWDDFRQQWPDLPAVVISENEADYDHASFARKPFTVDSLIDNITEAIILFSTEDGAQTKNKGVMHKEVSQANDAIDFVKEPDIKPDKAVTKTSKKTKGKLLHTPVDEMDMHSLSEIAGTLSSGGDYTNRKLDTPNYEENYFDPDAHIIGLVLKGIEYGEKSGEIARLACLLDRTIYIDAKNKIVSSNLKDIHMRQIAIAPLGEGESGLDTKLEMIKSKTLDELAGDKTSICPMETFVWELAMLTSNGRIPVGTPINEPAYLIRWPNFTRLMQIPNAMKVAAYWLRLPSSLTDLSENLGVPLNDIYLLYSAASLTGLAGLAKRKSDKLIKPGKPEKHKNRNLFDSIMGSLRKH